MIFYSEGMIARLLSNYQYGQWVYTLNLVTLMSSLALIAGAEVAVPALSRNKKIANEIMSNVFFIRIVFAIFAYLIVTIYAAVFVKDIFLKDLLHILSLIIIFNEPFSIVINYFQSIVKIRSVVVYRMLALSIRTLFVYVCFKYSVNSSVLAWSRVLEAFFLAVLLIGVWKYYKFEVVLNNRVFNVVILRGLYFWPSLLLMYIYLRVDRFFVEHYLSFSVLAIYGVAVQFVEQSFVLIKMILQSAAPMYIYKKQSKSELILRLVKLIVLMLVISISIITLSYWLLPYLVDMVFGEKYKPASELTIYMLPALIFFSIDNVLMQYIYREKLGKEMMIKWSAGLIIMAVSYYIYFSYLKYSNLYIIYNFNYFIMAMITSIIFIRKLRHA